MKLWPAAGLADTEISSFVIPFRSKSIGLRYGTHQQVVDPQPGIEAPPVSAEIENRRSALALGREGPPHARQRHTVAASDQRYRHLSHPHIIGGRWHCQFSEMFQLGGGQRSSIVLLFDVALVVVAHGGETLAGCGRVRSGPERSFAAHVCEGRRPRSRIMVRQT